MSVTLSGTLRDPYGQPVSGGIIRFEAVRTSTDVLSGVSAEATTDTEGAYSIDVSYGMYAIKVRTGGTWVELVGRIPITQDTTAASLNELLVDWQAGQDVTPAIILQMESIRDETRGYRDDTQAAADRATLEADRANTYADNAGYVTRERLRKQATLDLDFASGDYALDDGEKLRTTNAGEVLTVERATPKWVFGPNGKLREVPPNTLARQWNPETGEPEGVLIEESRTNLLLWSEDFTQGAWTTARASVSSNVKTAPDGTQGADELVEDAVTGTHAVFQSGRPVEAGVRYVASCYVKASLRSKLEIRGQSSSGWAPRPIASFDLSTGAVIGGAGEIEPLADGWFRCSAFGEREVDGTSGIEIFILDDAGSSSYQGDGESGIYIWGAQLEQVGS